MNQSSADPALADDFIGPGQVDLFAVMAAEIKLDVIGLLAAAADCYRVATVTEASCVDMLDGATGRADQGCRVVATDMRLNVGHCVQS
jgi:hypothetical protein